MKTFHINRQDKQKQQIRVNKQEVFILFATGSTRKCKKHGLTVAQSLINNVLLKPTKLARPLVQEKTGENFVVHGNLYKSYQGYC